VDLEIVWELVETELPSLRERLARPIAEL